MRQIAFAFFLAALLWVPIIIGARSLALALISD